jgi:Mn-dependent DtxR family transcriptional regulator
MPTQEVLNSTEVEEQIYDLLKRKGPLCASQIVADLDLSLGQVVTGLKKLENMGHVELKIGHDKDVENKTQLPWRIVRKVKTVEGR